jgi:hypothetical protein
MTVRELIDLLSKFPADADVEVDSQDFSGIVSVVQDVDGAVTLYSYDVRRDIADANS